LWLVFLRFGKEFASVQGSAASYQSLSQVPYISESLTLSIELVATLGAPFPLLTFSFGPQPLKSEPSLVL